MTNFSIRNSAVLRMGIVAVLGIMLLIPLSFVNQLIQDREKTRDSALREVTEKWGVKQTITGPILTIPIKRTLKTKEDTLKTFVEFAHFLPDMLTLRTRLSPEIRYRGNLPGSSIQCANDRRGRFSDPPARR